MVSSCGSAAVFVPYVTSTSCFSLALLRNGRLSHSSPTLPLSSLSFCVVAVLIRISVTPWLDCNFVQVRYLNRVCYSGVVTVSIVNKTAEAQAM